MISASTYVRVNFEQNVFFRDVHYALRVITGNVDGPCVMWIFHGNVPYFYGASLVLLGLKG